MPLFTRPTKNEDAAQGRVDNLESEIRSLKQDRDKLQKDVTVLEHKHKLETEDIQHMVRIKQEQLDVEHEKKLVEMDREKAAAIAEVKDEYRDKLEDQLRSEAEGIKKMYAQILERLPNVKMAIKQTS